MSLQRLNARYHAYRRINELIKMRNSGQLIDAGECWINKEIADLQEVLSGKEC